MKAARPKAAAGSAKKKKATKKKTEHHHHHGRKLTRKQVLAGFAGKAKQKKARSE